MSSSQRLLRRLGGLGNRLICAECAALEVHQVSVAGQVLSQETARAGPSINDAHGPRSVLNESPFSLRPQTLPFAALSLQQKDVPAAVVPDTAHTSYRLQQHQNIVVYFDDDQTHETQHPQPIGRRAKYADEEVRLTPQVILTPMREIDRQVTNPVDAIPLRADSVRRKRKHKMNKHKHKKRRKLQRHKN